MQSRDPASFVRVAFIRKIRDYYRSLLGQRNGHRVEHSEQVFAPLKGSRFHAWREVEERRRHGRAIFALYIIRTLIEQRYHLHGRWGPASPGLGGPSGFSLVSGRRGDPSLSFLPGTSGHLMQDDQGEAAVATQQDMSRAGLQHVVDQGDCRGLGGTERILEPCATRRMTMPVAPGVGVPGIVDERDEVWEALWTRRVPAQNAPDHCDHRLVISHPGTEGVSPAKRAAPPASDDRPEQSA